MYIHSCNRGDDVTILIDTKSGEPIYNQIYSQIKNQIISGELKENDMLPSIRGLAKDLRISFITTKHAYEELEKEGFIYTLPGKGCYVAPKNTEILREENLKRIEKHIEDIETLISVYDNMSSYQQGYISKETMDKFEDILEVYNVIKPSEETEDTNGESEGTQESTDDSSKEA